MLCYYICRAIDHTLPFLMGHLTLKHFTTHIESYLSGIYHLNSILPQIYNYFFSMSSLFYVYLRLKLEQVIILWHFPFRS
jgi:hypothetical protein